MSGNDKWFLSGEEPRIDSIVLCENELRYVFTKHKKDKGWVITTKESGFKYKTLDKLVKPYVREAKFFKKGKYDE